MISAVRLYIEKNRPPTDVLPIKLMTTFPKKVFTAGIGLAKNNVLLISNYKICWKKMHTVIYRYRNKGRMEQVLKLCLVVVIKSHSNAARIRYTFVHNIHGVNRIGIQL